MKFTWMSNCDDKAFSGRTLRRLKELSLSHLLAPLKNVIVTKNAEETATLKRKLRQLHYGFADTKGIYKDASPDTTLVSLNEYEAKLLKHDELKPHVQPNSMFFSFAGNPHSIAYRYGILLTSDIPDAGVLDCWIPLTICYDCIHHRSCAKRNKRTQCNLYVHYTYSKGVK